MMLLLAACTGDAQSEADAGLDPSADTPTEVLAFSVVIVGDEGSIDIIEGGEIPWLWGFQGGTMILPQIQFHADSGVEDEDSIFLSITHEPVPGDEDAFAVDTEFTLFSIPATVRSEGGVMVAGPVDDQLSWDELQGSMVMRVSVDGLAGEFVRTVTLVPGAPPAEDPCFDFAPDLGTGGCIYADILGTMVSTTVTELDATNTCGEPRGGIAGTFQTTEAGRACLERSFFGEDAPTEYEYEVPAAGYTCLSSVGISTGVEFDVVMNVLLEGTCSPGPNWTLSRDDSECSCSQ
ncbi:MAG: hypothetical protein ACJAYU_001598 [Bradymonadia bacterium]|jgi:hypothetical protein